MIVLHNNLLSLRQNMSNKILYVDVQVAYPFMLITSAVVYCFLIQLFFVSPAFISRGIAENDTSYMITGFLTIILYRFVLLGLLLWWCDILSNPLGNDVGNFLVYTSMNGYEKTFQFIVKEAIDVLETEEADDNSINWPPTITVIELAIMDVWLTLIDYSWPGRLE